eukprot:6969253-Prymnesium_polylepis.1
MLDVPGTSREHACWMSGSPEASKLPGDGGSLEPRRSVLCWRHTARVDRRPVSPYGSFSRSCSTSLRPVADARLARQQGRARRP